MQKIMTCLFFDGKAEDAVKHYVAIVKDAQIKKITHYLRDNSPLPKGTVMAVEFDIAGQAFLALNGPPMFSFTPAISLMVNCETQDEIDHVWEKLSEGGQQHQCGWLKDKFGVSWQVVPAKLGEWMRTANLKQAENMMGVMMQMTKLDMSVLQKAYDKK